MQDRGDGERSLGSPPYFLDSFALIIISLTLGAISRTGYNAYGRTGRDRVPPLSR
jgi:hypothetical protein